MDPDQTAPLMFATETFLSGLTDNTDDLQGKNYGEKIQVRGKSGKSIFSQENLEKREKKSREFHFFSKKLLFNRLLDIFHKLQAILEKEYSFSNIYGLRFLYRLNQQAFVHFSHCRWMKMAKIGLPKGSGKW